MSVETAASTDDLEYGELKAFKMIKIEVLDNKMEEIEV
jgi:hypothetical protein